MKTDKQITEPSSLEKEERRKEIFKKIDDLDDVVHILEATANVYYSSTDKMWNVLLKARDDVKKHIEKEKTELYKEVEILDKQKLSGGKERW